MATFTLTIECGNAAFCNDDGNPDADYRGDEVARILRETADWFETGSEVLSHPVATEPRERGGAGNPRGGPNQEPANPNTQEPRK